VVRVLRPPFSCRAVITTAPLLLTIHLTHNSQSENTVCMCVYNGDLSETGDSEMLSPSVPNGFVSSQLANSVPVCRQFHCDSTDRCLDVASRWRVQFFYFL
jgi:hypothetical protein